MSILEGTFKKISEIKYGRPSSYFRRLDEIPFKVFCAVVNSKNTGLLAKSHYDTGKDLIINSKKAKENSISNQCWDAIIEDYQSIEGAAGVADKIDRQVSILSLQNSFITIKAMIEFCSLTTPFDEKHGQRNREILADLDKMGYRISLENTFQYTKTLALAQKKLRGLLSLIIVKKNELKADIESRQKDSETEKLDFEQIYLLLCGEFPNLKESFTVSRYVSCKKILQERQRKLKKHDHN
jgi:hypothetical protein